MFDAEAVEEIIESGLHKRRISTKYKPLWRAIVLPREPVENRDKLSFTVQGETETQAEAEVEAAMFRDGYNTNLYYIHRLNRLS